MVYQCYHLIPIPGEERIVVVVVVVVDGGAHVLGVNHTALIWPECLLRVSPG